MNDPLNQHSVPQAYLKQFDAGKGIIVYDVSKRPDVSDLVRQVQDPHVELSVKNLAVEIDYYTRETSNGPDYSFEHMLGRIENYYWPAMKAVRSRKPLSSEQLITLAMLASVQDARVNRLSLVEPMEKIRWQAEMLYRQHHPDLSDDEIVARTNEFVREQILSTDIPSPRNIALAALPQMMQFSFDVFKFMFKSIVYSGAHHFVTSDAPVVWIDPAQFPEPRWKFYRLSGFMEVTFPLSRHACLVMAWHPMKQQVIGDEALVATINARTASYARRHVFATNTGAIGDRHRNGRDFTNMQAWMGMPLTAALTDEATVVSEDDAGNYQRCLAKLGIEWETARSENEQLLPRFTEAAEFYRNKQEEQAATEASGS